MLERIDPGGRHVGIGREVALRVEERIWVAAFLPAELPEMRLGVEAGVEDIWIVAQVIDVSTVGLPSPCTIVRSANWNTSVFLTVSDPSPVSVTRAPSEVTPRNRGRLAGGQAVAACLTRSGKAGMAGPSEIPRRSPR